MAKIKYTLKLVSIDRVRYASTGEILEVHYQIFQKGVKKAVWGMKQGMPLESSKEEVKAMLKQGLATYTQEHQPISEEEKQRLENLEKSDRVIKDMKGFQL